MLEIKLVPGKYPTAEEMTKARAISDVDHMETTYGNYWKIYLHNNGKHYLEFDIGHFASQFVTVEIDESKFNALKTDFSLFNEIANSVDPSTYIQTFKL